MPEPLKAKKRGHHICPKKGCRTEVPDARFACITHWYKLPDDVRADIIGSARLTLLNPRRRRAIEAARIAWGD
jgi:hypothetical protein